jgi:hypothetical protein
MRLTLGDLLLFGAISGAVWGVSAVIPVYFLYTEAAGAPPQEPAVKYVLLVVGIWAIAGTLLGFFSIWRFVGLVRTLRGNPKAYAIHFVGMCSLGLLLGGLLTVLGLPLLEAPSGAILRGWFWRVVVGALTGLSATTIALKVTPKFVSD